MSYAPAKRRPWGMKPVIGLGVAGPEAIVVLAGLGSVLAAVPSRLQDAPLPTMHMQP